MSNLILDITQLVSAALPKDTTEGKMTWADIKAMYPPPAPHEKEGRDGKRIRSRATLKNHRHVVQPVWLPARRLSLSPAEYRSKHLGKRKRNVVS